MNAANSQLVRDVREALFDTIIVAKNTAIGLRKVFFGDPSASGVGATAPQTTNLTKVGELPAPESMTVYGVVVAFTGMLASDIIGVCKNYALRLVVSGKPLLNMPLKLTPDSASKVIATVASDIVQFAECRIDFPEEFKIELTQGTPFYAELVSSTGFTTTDTNGQGAHIRVLLDGVHTLAVG